MRVTYVPDPKTFVGYYLDQAGGGSGQYFQGTQFQRGYGRRRQKGRGAIGNFFGKLFRFAMPLLKRGSKHVGQALARTGIDIASDAVQGGNIKESTKKHFKKLGNTLTDDASSYIKNQVGSGRKRKRSKRQNHKSFSRKRVKNDIFCS